MVVASSPNLALLLLCDWRGWTTGIVLVLNIFTNSYRLVQLET
jgi:hypothetical protein